MAREVSPRGSGTHPARQLRRPLRRAHQRDDRLGDPGALLGGQPPRGGLAGRRDAQHLRPARSTSSASAINDLVTRHGATAMQYGSGQGDPTLREQICDVMRLEGIEAHPDDVVVTVGSQQAVDLVTRIFCDPGDVVICEAPSYVGALGVFRAYESDVVHVEMDGEGLVPSALREAIATVQGQGRRIKFLYTIPNYHNPAGVTPERGAPHRDPRDLRRGRRAGARGQPLRPARLRRRADPGDAGRRVRRRHLPRVVLQDLRPRLPGRLGAGTRTPSARSSCWPRSRPPCARRPSPRWRCRPT